MKCPVCRKQTLKRQELMFDLAGQICSECSGTWIARGSYEAWRAKQPGDMPESSTPVQMAVTETHKPKICPQCGHLLFPYKVGHGLSFSIDYCGGCGGIWLDQNEWDALKAKNLHDNLHQIVSGQWQADVRQAGVQDAIEQSYSRQLGAAYAKAREIKAWLSEQPKKALILAYFTGSGVGK